MARFGRSDEWSKSQDFDWAWFARREKSARVKSAALPKGAAAKIKAMAVQGGGNVPDACYPEGWIARWYETGRNKVAA